MKFTINNAKRHPNGELYVTSSTVETSDGVIHYIPLSRFPTGSDEELLSLAQRYEDGLNASPDAVDQTALIEEVCQNMKDAPEFTDKVLTK